MELDAEKVGSNLKSVLSAVKLGQGKIDIKEFLVDDYARILDSIHDEIESGRIKDQQTGEILTSEKDWLKADALCQKLASMALRLSSKLTSLQKKHASLSAGVSGKSEDVTLDGVSALFDETTKFIAGFKALYVESGKLMKLIVTSEKVPLAWDDRYSPSHQIIIAFKDDFAGFSDRSLKAFEGQLERSVDAIKNKLEEFKVESDLPDWKQWKYPTDFKSAIDLVRKQKPPKTAADVLVCRVAARYAASTKR
jgi:hypothetical protein